MSNEDFIRINQPRVEQILEKLKQIVKSGNSQKATEEEIGELFAPIARHFGTSPVSHRTEEELNAFAAKRNTLKKVGMAQWKGAIDQISHMRYNHAIMLGDAIPADLVGTVMTTLTDRLCEMAAVRKGGV